MRGCGCSAPTGMATMKMRACSALAENVHAVAKQTMLRGDNSSTLKATTVAVKDGHSTPTFSARSIAHRAVQVLRGRKARDWV